MSDNCEKASSEGGQGSATRESWLGRHGPWVLLLAYLYYCIQVAMEIFGGRVDSLDMLPLVGNSIVVLMVAALLGVVVRVVAQVVRRASWVTILRDIVGEPSWWRTWYPRSLRGSGSIWEELPLTLKVMRTGIWLELLLLPAGVVLFLFVLPTFQVVYSVIGIEFPLMMRTFNSVVQIGGYALPLILLGAFVQSRRWRGKYGMPSVVTLNAWFSVNQDFWRESEARQLLRH